MARHTTPQPQNCDRRSHPHLSPERHIPNLPSAPTMVRYACRDCVRRSARISPLNHIATHVRSTRQILHLHAGLLCNTAPTPCHPMTSSTHPSPSARTQPGAGLTGAAKRARLAADLDDAASGELHTAQCSGTLGATAASGLKRVKPRNNRRNSRATRERSTTNWRFQQARMVR